MPTAFEVITGGKGARTVAPMNPDDVFYPVAEKAVTKRAYDPQRTQQLLDEVGLVRGPDGMYRTAAGEPFIIDSSYILQQSNQRENEIFAASLRAAGVGVTLRPFTGTEVRDMQLTKSYPGISAVGSYGGKFVDYTSSQIPTAANRYNGSNTGGWAPAEYERLVGAFIANLDSAQRAQQVAAMARMWSDDIPSFPNYWTPITNAWTSNLTNVTARKKIGVAPLDFANNWEWAS